MASTVASSTLCSLADEEPWPVCPAPLKSSSCVDAVSMYPDRFADEASGVLTASSLLMVGTWRAARHLRTTGPAKEDGQRGRRRRAGQREAAVEQDAGMATNGGCGDLDKDAHRE